MASRSKRKRVAAGAAAAAISTVTGAPGPGFPLSVVGSKTDDNRPIPVRLA